MQAQAEHAATLKAVAQGVAQAVAHLKDYLEPIHGHEYDMHEEYIIADIGEMPRCLLVREMVGAVSEMLKRQQQP